MKTDNAPNVDAQHGSCYSHLFATESVAHSGLLLPIIRTFFLILCLFHSANRTKKSKAEADFQAQKGNSSLFNGVAAMANMHVWDKLVQLNNGDIHCLRKNKWKLSLQMNGTISSIQEMKEIMHQNIDSYQIHQGHPLPFCTSQMSTSREEFIPHCLIDPQTAHIHHRATRYLTLLISVCPSS